MKTANRNRLLFVLCAGLLVAALGVAPAPAADIVLVFFDPPGQGTNDLTPVAPVGGNPGTTLGEQRRNVYELAAQIWGDTLASDQTIFVAALFQPLPCSPTGAVLGSAGPTFVVRDFAGAGFPGTWYVSAHADAVSGVDQVPGFVDLVARFNSDIDDDPNCLVGREWYYGFDNNQGTDLDFLTVALHEFNHGLGFLELVSEATGAFFLGFPDIYTKYMLDLTLGTTWDNLTDAERLSSQTNDGNLVWNGNSVTDAAPAFLGPRPSVLVLNPKSIKGSYEAQAASFGPPLRSNGGTTGKMVLADDGVDATADACEPILNNVNGKVAVVDRGGCTFVSKVLNAQNAGAKGVIVVNNSPVGRPPMGGSSADVTIPSVGVSMADGDLIKDVLPSNSEAKLILDGDFLAGTNQGFVRLYAPGTVAPGSSKSHWDTSASPSLLMEPFITPNLESAQTLDLSPNLMQDIGWILLP
jgi:hypothetical protein